MKAKLSIAAKQDGLGPRYEAPGCWKHPLVIFSLLVLSKSEQKYQLSVDVCRS